jgi:CheY-like chemotaxis protein
MEPFSVYSELDMGTTFKLLIPEKKNQTLQSSAESSTSAMTGKGNILIVDDEESIVKWTTSILSKLGYTVTACTSSTEALDIFKKDPSRFDLVLTDMTMPEMDGIELSNKLVLLNPDIPIVLCTGLSKDFTSKKGAPSGICWRSSCSTSAVDGRWSFFNHKFVQCPYVNCKRPCSNGSFKYCHVDR